MNNRHRLLCLCGNLQMYSGGMAIFMVMNIFSFFIELSFQVANSSGPVEFEGLNQIYRFCFRAHISIILI